MLLQRVAVASERVAATSARTSKVTLIADCLREAPAEEVETVVAYLSGDLPQRRTGIGWASLRDLPPAAAAPTLTVSETDAAISRAATIAGPGTQAARAQLVTELFGRATDTEQRLLRGLLTGELRQGALEAVMVDAVARATGASLADVRRAVMLCGAVGPPARAALAEGPQALDGFHLQVGRPVQPMLASPATDVAAALDKVSPAAIEWKLDGVRIQVHREGTDVAVFTRSLDDVTGRVPEVVELALSLPSRSFVLDGEAIALRDDGRPRPFQQTGSRIGSTTDVAAARRTAPLSSYFFDVLHLDGSDRLVQSGTQRFEAL